MMLRELQSVIQQLNVKVNSLHLLSIPCATRRCLFFVPPTSSRQDKRCER